MECPPLQDPGEPPFAAPCADTPPEVEIAHLRFPAPTNQPKSSAADLSGAPYRIAGAALRLAFGCEEARIGSVDEARAAIVSVIEQHYAEPLSLDCLAEMAELSRHHFLRTFRRVVGVTPYHYVLAGGSARWQG